MVRPERIHYLDWLKVLIVYGIFFFHLSLVFSIVPWLVNNREHSLLLSGFGGFTFVWGIPAMFLIAGADAWFSIRSRSVLAFVRARFLRLVVPLGPAMLLMTPYQRWISSSSPPPPLSALPDFYAAYLRHPTWDPLHLWFLAYLFAISMAALPVLLAQRSRAGRGVVVGLVGLSRLRGGLLSLAIPLALTQLWLRPRFPLYLEWADVASYLYVFVLGAVLFSDRGFEQGIRRDIRLALAVGVAAIVTIGLLLLFAPGHAPYGPRTARWAQALYSAAYAADIWAWLLAVLYLGLRWLDFPNATMSHACESILPFYILHHPVLVTVAAYVVPLALELWIKAGLITLVAFPTTLLLYEFVVRRSPLLRFVFGLKPPGTPQPAQLPALRAT